MYCFYWHGFPSMILLPVSRFSFFSLRFNGSSCILLDEYSKKKPQSVQCAAIIMCWWNISHVSNEAKRKQQPIRARCVRFFVNANQFVHGWLIKTSINIKYSMRRKTRKWTFNCFEAIKYALTFVYLSNPIVNFVKIITATPNALLS